MTQPIKSAFLIFEPVDPVDVANGALFLDSTNSNKLSHKDLSGAVYEIGAGGGGGTGYFVNLLDGLTNAVVTVGDPYDTSTNKLAVYRNGVRLLRTAGSGADRYTETSSTSITLGTEPVATDVLVFINRAALPNFTTVTGITGVTLTVPSYTMGNDSLMIWKNGSLMNGSGIGDTIDRYTEATSTTVTLDVAAIASDVFTVEIIQTPIARQDSTGLTGTTLTVPSYTMSNEKLLVFRNGVLMHNSASVGTSETRYQEVSSTTISLALAANTEDVFSFIVQQ